MTRLCTLALALAAASSTTLPLLAQPPKPPAAPAPATQPAKVSPLAAIAAQQLARAAIVDFRTITDPGPIDARYSSRLLRDASLLDPTNADVNRLALEAAKLAGNQQTALDLCRALVTINPADTAAQLDLIEARLAMCPTVEERFTILDSLLGPRGDGLDPAIRSRLAFTSALLRRERGDMPGFVKDLTAATTLDSSNYTAAAKSLEYYATRAKDADGKFELLVNTLLASPLDATIHAAIAHELAAAGATEQAVRFYENARSLYARQGTFLPLDGTQEEYLIQTWKLTGPEGVIKPLNDAIDSERRKAQIDIDVANATNKPTEGLPLPASFRQPIAIERIRLAAAFAAGDRSTMDRSLVDFQASISALSANDPARAGIETEAAYLRALTNSGDISGEVSRIRGRAGSSPEAVARLEAWTKHRKGSSAAARTAFEAMKDDQLAKLALAAMDVEANPAAGSAQARALNDRLTALAAENPASPISAWATTVYKARNEGKAPPSSTKAEKFAAMGAGIPAWLDDLAKDPGKLIVIRVEPANTRGLSPLEPAILNIRISNNTPIPIAIGPGVTVDSRLLVTTTVDIGGVPAPEVGRTEVITMGGKLRLLPREEAVFSIWADPGFGGWALQNGITKAGRLRYTVIQGFVVDDVPKPGPFGSSIEAGPIRRSSLPLSDPVRLCGDLATLQDEEFATALLLARLHFISHDKPVSAENAKSLVNIIADRYRRGTSIERIAILTLTPTPRMSPPVAELEGIINQIDEVDPAVARAVLLTRVENLKSPLLNKFRLFPETGVQEAVRMVESRITGQKPLFAAATLAGGAPKPPAPPAPPKPPAGDPAAPPNPAAPAPAPANPGLPIGPASPATPSAPAKPPVDPGILLPSPPPSLLPSPSTPK